MSKNRRGFTLIELMIVVAVIAILAAIALPSFLGQVRKSRRADAQATIQQIALKEERFRADNPGYSSTWTDLGGNPNTYNGAFYTWAIVTTAAAPPTYTLTATATGGQAGDKALGTSCATLTYGVDASGQVNYGTNAACWQK